MGKIHNNNNKFVRVNVTIYKITPTHEIIMTFYIFLVFFFPLKKHAGLNFRSDNLCEITADLSRHCTYDTNSLFCGQHYKYYILSCDRSLPMQSLLATSVYHRAPRWQRYQHKKKKLN